ncbi:MAG: hypothetical protein ACLPY1_08100 [Terracidiphilus sp.]
MIGRMERSIPVLALFALCAAGVAAQDASQSNAQQNPYQGVSRPPADDTIITTSIPEPKPPAGQPMNANPAPQPYRYTQPAPAAMPPAAQYEPRPTSVDPSVNFPSPESVDGTDDGIVRIAPSNPPALNQRTYAYDPDGDIVHPHPLRPGELQEGTSIRVRLLGQLSTVDSEKDERFRTRVATDVLQDGRVLIPAGAEIDGRVVEVSRGHAGGSGTMRLQPESVILPDGTRWRLHAEVTGTPGSRTHVVGEGTIKPDSRAKRDGIEYGGAVGAGVVTGAIVAGPVGALTGGIIGAGAITVHLLVSHPQARLEPGATLIFQLTDRLYLAPEAASGN